ncbi:hypothetical protein U1Q18_040465 [Sarracenia purpurea var. burkii]
MDSGHDEVESEDGAERREHRQDQTRRVVGQGNNLLGSRYALGRGGYAQRGRFRGRAGRFTDNRPWTEVVTGPKIGESSGDLDISPESSSLANRCSSGQLNFVEIADPDNPEVIEIEEDAVDESSWEDCLVGYLLDATLPFGLMRELGKAVR